MADTLKVLDLFSGIGGFSLGLERTGGFETIAFCEVDPYARRVIEKHWPDVPVFGDVRNLTAEVLSDTENMRRTSIQRQQSDGALSVDGDVADPEILTERAGLCESEPTEQRRRRSGNGHCAIDVSTAGFPCQPISVAGKRQGPEDERWLWPELARVIGEVRPVYAILENVTALCSGDHGRWFGTVLGDLAEIGYDCEWHCIQAADLGAPHIRDRVWIIAYPGGERRQQVLSSAHGNESPDERRASAQMHQSGGNGERESVADAASQSRQSQRRRQGQSGDTTSQSTSCGWWQSEPDVGRVADGVPARVDRLRCLGNAIVPQMAELIGRAILESRQA